MELTIRKGLDVALDGAPKQQITGARRVETVAWMGADYPGLSARVVTEVGREVRLGDVVVRDERHPELTLTAPGTGTVHEIRRGARGALQALVIQLAKPGGADIREGPVPATGPEAAKSALLASGLWSALRERPFGRIPAPTRMPRSIFVTALDTDPLAPDPAVVLAAAGEDFERGVRFLTALTEGEVHVCRARGADIPVAPAERVAVHEFTGPHPAGLVGTHIHFLDPVGRGRAVWHVGYADVAAIGRFARCGEISPERVIALAGPDVERPRLVRTRLGAAVNDLIAGETRPGRQRVLSGSVLDGRQATSWGAYLGRFHRQIAVVPEPRVGGPAGVTTALHGGRTAMFPMGVFERVTPLGLLVAPLLRALLVGDASTAEALGCLELEEEDLALCTYVCPAKIEYGAYLRAMLDRLEAGA